MNNQVKLIDESKMLEWIDTMYNKKLPDELKEYRNGRQVVLDLLEIQIKSGCFAPDTPPVPTIGCSECDYKGYFEYETGVVDEGTGIKEIAKEPCDCVIDSVPTIKPGDKARHPDLGEVVVQWVGDNIAEVAVGIAHYDVSLKDLEVVE